MAGGLDGGTLPDACRAAVAAVLAEVAAGRPSPEAWPWLDALAALAGGGDGGGRGGGDTGGRDEAEGDGEDADRRDDTDDGAPRGAPRGTP